MNKNLTAKAAASIAATRDKVWEALITPNAIKEYMFGTDVETDWKKGSKIIWKGEFKGKKYDDKGEILNIIVIYGSASIIQELTKHELVDEYQFLVHPIIQEKGIPLFKDKVNLKLVKSEPFKSGVVLLTYQLGKK